MFTIFDYFQIFKDLKFNKFSILKAPISKDFKNFRI